MKHVCEVQTTCTCSLISSEPDEHCPIHGAGPWTPRCVYCGRFLSYPPSLISPEKEEDQK